jgi:dTDP-4-amino-4,6-dideoxygalactose transaminase
MAVQAMGLTGEVITTPFTFASTTHAIVRNGLTPVFCDINPVDYTIDCDQLEDLINEKTSAIIPVHVYGHICDVERIEKIAEKHGLKVIYDAAHAFGITYKGRGIGSYGDASIFSFHATKVFNTIEGGAVAYGSADYGKLLYQLKNFGIKNEIVVDGIGANAKMNEFQAAMGLCNLRHIEQEIAKRKIVVEHYRERLAGHDGLQLAQPQQDVVSNYAYFPVVVSKEKFGKSRDDICVSLQEHNIFSRKYFYPLTSRFECYPESYDQYPTPVALEISEQVLTLPLYADLTLEQVDKICDIIFNM